VSVLNAVFGISRTIDSRVGTAAPLEEEELASFSDKQVDNWIELTML
jgi:hypothetical protein